MKFSYAALVLASLRAKIDFLDFEARYLYKLRRTLRHTRKRDRNLLLQYVRTNFSGLFYWNNREKTRSTFPVNGVKTGDRL